MRGHRSKRAARACGPRLQPTNAHPLLHCQNTPADVRITGLTSHTEVSGGPTFKSILVKRSAAVRDTGPHLGTAHAPLDVVVWNPNADRARTIPDLDPEEYRSYVCVEPGRVSPATASFPAHRALAPGQKWTLIQTVQLEYE